MLPGKWPATRALAVKCNINELTRNMNRLLFVLLILFSGVAFAAENLDRDDYKGEWKSNYAAVESEKQILRISLEALSVFERHFEGNDSQVLSTEKYEFIDDLFIITFHSPGNVFSYKLALSGWKSSKQKTLHGSMFMYRSEIQFNMLPVSFVSVK